MFSVNKTKKQETARGHVRIKRTQDRTNTFFINKQTKKIMKLINKFKKAEKKYRDQSLEYLVSESKREYFNTI